MGSFGSLDNLMAPRQLPSAAAASPSDFPVVFFDGNGDVHIGNVAIDASTVFKRFRLLISQKIGISPHRISLFLVRRKKGRFSPEFSKKIPIDESCDFSAITNERDSFVFTELKRSRRESRWSLRRGGGAESLIQKNTNETPKKMLLRRPSGFYERAAVGASAEERPGLGLGFGFVDSYRNLQRQRERYLISTATASYDNIPDSGAVRRGVDARANTAVCEVCLASKVMPVPFHCCVYDAVTVVGFRSNVGPVQRPSKGHVEASGWTPFSGWSLFCSILYRR